MAERLTATADRPRLGLVSMIGRVVRRPAGLVGLVLLGAIVGLALLGPKLSPGDPFHIGSAPMLRPSRSHPFGTDNIGRDGFRSVIHGLRTTLLVVVGTTAISAALGVVFGVVAGYYGGGLLDRIFLRLVEVLQTVPRLFLAILAVTLFGGAERNLIIVLGLTSWVFLARIVRAEALSVRSRPYVEAARASGSGDLRIIACHLVPNVAPVAIVVIALNASGVILVEAGLAFIGLGDSNRMSLGTLINTAQVFLREAWWMSVFPGAAIALTVLSINLLGDALNDARSFSEASPERRPGALRRSHSVSLDELR